uniref:Uncharacterized protein n=1 Tax=Caenorhabditis japonica TaxID=281687 RepID=A0A8R1EY35_CAEJA
MSADTHYQCHLRKSPKKKSEREKRCNLPSCHWRRNTRLPFLLPSSVFFLFPPACFVRQNLSFAKFRFARLQCGAPITGYNLRRPAHQGHLERGGPHNHNTRRPNFEMILITFYALDRSLVRCDG